MPVEKTSLQKLMPGLLEQEICLGAHAWTWGDNSSPHGLMFLCMLAARATGPIVEIGTFRGRTTYNLALNAPTRIYTVDLGAPPPAEAEANAEHKAYPSYTPGEVFLSARPEIREKIELIIGDSTRVDLSALRGQASLVIVDAGHTYEACMADSKTAFSLVRPGGHVVWDDYGGDYWPGVKRALDEIALERTLHYLPRENFVIYQHPQ